MNEIKFLEKYNEAAIENFVAVVKQNILFQAQIAALSEENQLVPELQKQILDFEPVKELVERLRDENISLTNELNNKINIIESANKSDAEKYRLQTSLNEQSREIERLNNGLTDLREQLDKKTEYVAKLEEMLPKSAMKNLGITQETNQEEGTIDNENSETLSSGGSF
jgi:predicted RNase H-like nuclease (RuvC/YqgF family)